MAPSRTKTSTPKLSEAARHLVYPSTIVKSGWPRIERRLADMAITFDPWQQGFSRLALGKDKNGKYACTVGGVVASIPRQVGKTFTVGSLIIALCIEFAGLKVLWTAHRTRTTTNTFRSMQGMVKRKRVKPHLMPGRNNGIRTANGEQEIAFRNGSLIMFGAREQGFGRGFDEVDVIVFDEAQILGEKALEDMVASTNQSRHPHGALLFFIGTPPRPVDPGEAFTAKRKKALSGKADDLIYLEFSADPDSDPDDESQWPVMNPSYPARTPREAMLRLRENLTSVDSWNREARGIWDSDEETHFFGKGTWEARKTDVVAPDKPAAVGIAVSVDRAYTSLGASGLREGGKRYVGAVDRRRGTGWAVAEAVRIAVQHGCLISLDGKGPASTLLPDLREAMEEAGLAEERLIVAGASDLCDASALMYDLVEQDELEHGDHPWLNRAVRGAAWRDIGDRKAIGRKTSLSDPSMLEAAALAVWAPTQAEPEERPFNVW